MNSMMNTVAKPTRQFCPRHAIDISNLKFPKHYIKLSDWFRYCMNNYQFIAIISFHIRRAGTIEITLSCTVLF